MPAPTAAPQPTLAPPQPTATQAPAPAPTPPQPTATPVPTVQPPTPTPTPEPMPAGPIDPADLEGEVLTLLYWQAPSILNPYLSGGTKDTDAAAVILQPLANYDPEGVLVPALAAEIPTVENGGISADLTAITWTLKDGLRWSDGSDLTADDVVFTHEYCLDEASGCSAYGSVGDTTVEALDDLTVRFTFSEPKQYPYTTFIGSGAPILSRAQFAECVGEASHFCADENYAPLGPGPYRVVEFVPEEQAVFERNPHYHGDRPYFDHVVIIGGGDALTAATSVLEDGAADFAWNLQIAPGALTELEAAGQGTVVSAFSSLVERIVVNQTNPDPALGDDRSEYLDGANPHPLFSLPAIPQAMSMALDRGLIASWLYGFAGEPTCNLITGPPAFVSTANDACLTQDIAGAKQLLDDNDVVDADGDGVREYNGMPLKITFQTSTNEIRLQTQYLARVWWAQIGIDAKIIHHDAAVFFGGDPVDDKEFVYTRFFTDVQMYATGPGIDPHQYLTGLTCAEIPTVDNHWGGNNTARSCDAEFDALVESLAELPIGPERNDLIQRLNDYQVQRYYEIPLINRGSVSAHANSLRGVRMNGWDSELWNIAEWTR